MSRTVPSDARQDWPYEGGQDQWYGGGHDVPDSGYGDMTGASAPENDSQGYGEAYNGQAHNGQGYEGQDYGPQYPAAGYEGQWYGQGYSDHGYAGQDYSDQGYAGQDYSDQGYAGQEYAGQEYAGQEYAGQEYADQGYAGHGYPGQEYGAQGFGPGDQGYGAQGFGPGDQGYASQPTRQFGVYPGQPAMRYDDQHHGADQGYADQGYSGQAYAGQDYADGYAAPGFGGHEQGYPGQTAWQQEPYAAQTAPQREFRGQGDQPGSTPPGPKRGATGIGPGKRKVHFRRLRRFARRPTVRVIAAIFAVFFAWVMFSAGQAAFQNNGQGFTANLAEWARDHYLGPLVTFGEWVSYSPPKSGGEPTFAYTVPKNERVTPVTTKGKHQGFVPDIPPTVKSLAAGAPLSGEGQWRVVEKVKGEPAILITFLRDGGQYTSYSNGIASMDQRLVKFSLRPGTEDPGAGNWGVPNYIPSGQRTGLVATFNGGFKLDSAQGGFYLNGNYHGSLVNGAASIVYYKNGTIKIGEWGRDFTMNSKVEGVRQNLKLLVDHGKVSSDANLAVNTNWGATLGGGAWVWRSGIGITKDGRVIFVYGQALDAHDLAELLQRAGAVEGMQMDINPAWMKFDYYKANGHPSDPTPVPLLPAQQPSAYSYYSPSTRDFTAVYAR